MSLLTRLLVVEHALRVEIGETWPDGGGLAALLQYAERKGLRAQSALADEDLPTTGLGQALREARAWQRDQGRGAS